MMPPSQMMMENPSGPRGRFIPCAPGDPLPRKTYPNERAGRLNAATSTNIDPSQKEAIHTSNPKNSGPSASARKISKQPTASVPAENIVDLEIDGQDDIVAGPSNSGPDTSDAESDVMVVGQRPGTASMETREPEPVNIENSTAEKDISSSVTDSLALRKERAMKAKTLEGAHQIEAMLDVNNQSGLFEAEEVDSRATSGDCYPVGSGGELLDDLSTSEELVMGTRHANIGKTRGASKKSLEATKSPGKWHRNTKVVRNVPYDGVKNTTQVGRMQLIERIKRNWPQAELFWPSALVPRSDYIVKDGTSNGIKVSVGLEPRDISNNLLEVTVRLSGVTINEHDRAHAAVLKAVRRRAKKEKTEEKMTLQDVEDAIKICSTQNEAQQRAREVENLTSPTSPTLQLRNDMARTSIANTVATERVEQEDISMQEAVLPQPEAVVSGRKRSYDDASGTVTWEIGSMTSWADSQQWVQHTFEMMLEDAKAADKRVRMSLTLV